MVENFCGKVTDESGTVLFESVRGRVSCEYDSDGCESWNGYLAILSAEPVKRTNEGLLLIEGCSPCRIRISSWPNGNDSRNHVYFTCRNYPPRIIPTLENLQDLLWNITESVRQINRRLDRI